MEYQNNDETENYQQLNMPEENRLHNQYLQRVKLWLGLVSYH